MSLALHLGLRYEVSGLDVCFLPEDNWILSEVFLATQNVQEVHQIKESSGSKGGKLVRAVVPHLGRGVVSMQCTCHCSRLPLFHKEYLEIGAKGAFTDITDVEVVVPLLVLRA